MRKEELKLNYVVCNRKPKTLKENGHDEDAWCAEATLATKENGHIFEAEDWMIDSGGSHHMTNQKGLFIDFEEEHSWVRVTSKAKLPTEGRGTTRIKVKNGKGVTLITLSGVLYVPEIGRNILSVERIDPRDIM